MYIWGYICIVYPTQWSLQTRLGFEISLQGGNRSEANRLKNPLGSLISGEGCNLSKIPTQFSIQPWANPGFVGSEVYTVWGPFVKKNTKLHVTRFLAF